MLFVEINGLFIIFNVLFFLFNKYFLLNVNIVSKIIKISNPDPT